MKRFCFLLKNGSFQITKSSPAALPRPISRPSSLCHSRRLIPRIKECQIKAKFRLNFLLKVVAANFAVKGSLNLCVLIDR